MNRHRKYVLAIASISFGLLVATPARAGTYSKVDQSTWQQGVAGLPSYVNMYVYLPSTLATKPPIVVGIHHCQGSASSSHSEMASLESIADKNGFIMIYPEATGENCWDAGSTRSLKHDGGGDTQAIAQMVRYALSKYSGDAGRVYSVGGSSGGIMTEAMLGVYPDIFLAGVSLMGVPCGCWAESYNDTTGTGTTAQWSVPCGDGTVTKTPAGKTDTVAWAPPDRRVFGSSARAIAIGRDLGRGRPLPIGTWHLIGRSGFASPGDGRRQPARGRSHHWPGQLDGQARKVWGTDHHLGLTGADVRPRT